MRHIYSPGSVVAAGLGLLAWLTACTTEPGAPTPTRWVHSVIPSETATSLPPATSPVSATSSVTPSATPSVTAEPTRQITSTPIPGFEGWTIFRPQAVEVMVDGESLILTLRQRALWFMHERGVLVYQTFTGNFKLTAAVRAARQSDPERPPGGDGSVELGGLMARAGSGAENYVFIVIGDDGDGLSVETKTTQNNVSQWDGPSWDSAEAELRVCRVADVFTLYKRHRESDEAWILAATFHRPDLPETLQVGVNIYSDSTPDLRVRYDQIQIAAIAKETECLID